MLCSISHSGPEPAYVVTSVGTMLIIVAACNLFSLLVLAAAPDDEAGIGRWSSGWAYEASLTGGGTYNQFLMEAELIRRQDGRLAVWVL